MVVVYDIEVIKNYFLYLDYDLDTGKVHSFEVSIFKNELDGLLKHLENIKAQIGFNNVNYDSQIIQHIRNNAKDLKKMTNDQVTTFISDYSNYVVSIGRENNQWPDYGERKLQIPQLDLFKVWHYDNKARSCSLKWLQYSMDWHNIEDMPVHHLDRITNLEIAESIKGYCLNDVMSTYQFYLITQGITDHNEFKGRDKLKFRKDISERLGIQCRNYNDVKIGDEINKQNYMKASGLSWREIKSLPKQSRRFTFGDCYPDYVEFKSKELSTFFTNLKDIYIDPNSDQKFKVSLDGVDYTIAKGGLHSIDKPRKIRPLSHQILRDADVGSMYPNAIRKRRLFPPHLGEKWLDGYTAIIQERLDAKGDESKKSIVEALKLALNGGSFGKTNESTNWQYAPFITFAVTIGCQVDLLMLIEDLVLAGIRVVSANTDGIVCLFDKNKEDEYYKICTAWEKQVGNHDLGKLEYVDYALIAQTAVNDYIAVKTNGKAKHKGDFLIDFELHKNKSFRVVNLALDAYYCKGINPVKFIREHNNIFDFCAGIRVKEGWGLELRGIDKGQYVTDRLLKTNRYYISNSGQKLIKMNKEDGRENQVDAGKWMCTIYNKHVEKPISTYDINYNYYIEETYKIISNIEPQVVSPYSSQLALFEV